MGEIKILPKEVRKLIAAGEVVETPANVVKELIENSLDAEATRIEVEILQAGKRLIKVRDNGKGILPEDLPKVIEEGATSKISTAEELYSIKTYGFRGEALHSVARVSRLYIRSRHFSQSSARELFAEGGKLVYLKEAPHPVGTSVEVRDLFFNFPVRLKFLKSNRTERKRITDTFIAYALANPKVYFSLEIEGKEVFSLPPSSVEERFLKIFSLEREPEKAEAENPLGKAKIYYYTNYKSNKFFVFLNGRPIYNREIQTYLKNKLGYKTLAALFLEIPPYEVDVNVHPKKEEVKFLRERKVLELIGLLFGKKEKRPTPLLLKQEIKPSYGVREFEIFGQLEETLILAYRDGFVYFFDQHLLDEVANFNRLGDENRACKISVKVGQKLTKEEMENLIKTWEELGEPKTCPHGRPVYYKLPLSEVYKKLGR